MKKYKDLIKNIGVLTLSNFGSKILSFLLVPLYTSILTTEEYGNFDFITVTISLLIPILTLNITEAALRFLLDKKNNQKDIFEICLKTIIISIFILLILVIVNRYLNIIPILNVYNIFFVIYYIVSLNYEWAQNFTRGLDKLSNIAIGSIINSIFILFLNILFLVIFKLGLKGYFLANIIANIIATSYLLISINIKQYIKFDTINVFCVSNKRLKKEMLKYSKPLMVNSIGWWINNVSDRYIVTYILGVAENGIYSVAYKIPSILSIIQSIFNQAWAITAVKTFDKNDEDRFFESIYVSYNFLMVCWCSILIILTKFLASILYKNEFYNAWKYMPFLMISIVFSAISGLLGGIFSAVKNSKMMSVSTMVGAIINIILNFFLIHIVGTIGVAISTAISCCIVWIIRMIRS